MKIILIGFMGAGKTSLAKSLAEALQWPMVETDALVLQKTLSRTMHEVFSKGGEALLRTTEKEIAQAFRKAQKVVISTGGGVVLDPMNMDHLKNGQAKTFFLKASFETLRERLKNEHSRPLWNNENPVQQLFQVRQPLYEKYADHTLEVDQKTVEALTQEIIEHITRIAPNGK